MSYELFEALISQYGDALGAELEANRVLAEKEAGLKAVEADVLVQAYREGTIDGKNAEIRKQQEIMVLVNNGLVDIASMEVQRLQIEASNQRVLREKAYQMLSLVKAWLYSQSGVER